MSKGETGLEGKYARIAIRCVVLVVKFLLWGLFLMWIFEGLLVCSFFVSVFCITKRIGKQISKHADEPKRRV